MINDMLECGGCRTGLIGTIEICDGVNTFPSINTTPDTLYLHRKLADMVRHGVKYCVMEVSSQGLMCSRISGMDVDVAVYTNLSPDHIGANEHRTFEEYCRWKRKLFSECRYAVINADDMYSGMFEQTAEEAGACLVRYGVKNGDAVCGRCVHRSIFRQQDISLKSHVRLWRRLLNRRRSGGAWRAFRCQMNLWYI